MNGACSLASAITAANTDTATGGCAAGDGADTISITADITLTAELPSISSNITIQSDDEDVKRAISGDNRFRILRGISGGELTINNLILKNGRAYDDDYRINDGDKGGAIWMLGGVGVTIKNSELRNNKAAQGGAIYFDRAWLRVENSSFIQNTAASGGGAIFNFTAGDITVSNSLFQGNRSTGDNDESEGYGDGGAIDIGLATSAGSITNSIFKNNSAKRLGGAVTYFGTSGGLTVRNVTFSGNRAGEEGGALYTLGRQH